MARERVTAEAAAAILHRSARAAAVPVLAHAGGCCVVHGGDAEPDG